MKSSVFFAVVVLCLVSFASAASLFVTGERKSTALQAKQPHGIEMHWGEGS